MTVNPPHGNPQAQPQKLHRALVHAAAQKGSVLTGVGVDLVI